MGSQLSVIRGNVRRNLGETTARFYSDTELNQYIGEGYKNYFKLMVYEGEGYFEVSTYLSLVANQEAYSVAALNPPFFQISALERVLPQGTRPLEQSERRFRPNYTYSVGVGISYIPTFRMQSLNIILEPFPTFSETGGAGLGGLKLDYIYVPTFPSSSSADSFTFDANFSVTDEPLVELYATIAALESKDGMGGVSDISSFRDRLAKLEENFIENLTRYEAPDRVQYSGNNYSDFNGWWW